MSNQKPYRVSNKERLRRFKLRIEQLFSKPYKKLPNFWYDPFEVYLLEHFKRAYHILTYDEYYYVDNCMRNIDKVSKDISGFSRTITMKTLPNGDVGVIKDGYYYVDNCMRNIKFPIDDNSCFVGTITMRTLPNGDVEVIKDGWDRPLIIGKPLIISENPDNS